MSEALQLPPVSAAAASPEGERRTKAVDDDPADADRDDDTERRTTVRRAEPAPLDDVVELLRRAVDDAPLPDVRDDESAPVVLAASWRRAAWTPARAADHPMGRSARGTARRVTGPTAAPGRGRAEL